MKSLSFNSRALIANFVVWSLFIGISLSASLIDSTRAGNTFEILPRVTAYLISFVPWMLVTPIFYWLLNWNHQRKYLPLLSASLILLFGWAPFVAFFETYSYMVMRPTPDKSLFLVMLGLPLFYWVYCLMLFGVILGACLSVLYYRRLNLNRIEALRVKQANAELELQLSELRIQSLLSQLEPHFLFNALNAIASLVRIADKKEALTAIKQLSDLLRFALQAGSQKFVSFEKELSFVQDYLSLQSLRFAEKLNVTINDHRSVKNQECPPFLLQVFVENAIKHGLEESGSNMQLVINIEHFENDLVLSVENTLPNNAQDNAGMGIGLSNLQARLNILYQQQINIENSQTSEIYQMKVRLPAYRCE